MKSRNNGVIVVIMLLEILMLAGIGAVAGHKGEGILHSTDFIGAARASLWCSACWTTSSIGGFTKKRTKNTSTPMSVGRH